MLFVLIITALLASLLLITKPAPWKKKSALAGAVTAFILISTGWVPELIMPTLTQTEIKAEPTGDRQAIVLLGGGLDQTTDGADAIPFYAYSRISKAVELLQQCQQQNKSCTLLISGGSPAGRVSEASLYAGFIRKLGISEHLIQIEEKSQNTWQNAQFSQPILAQYDAISIVTNGLHARRTALYFQHFGVQAEIVSSDQFPVRLRPWQWGLNWFVFEVEIHEWVGIARYHLYQALGLNKTTD